MKKTINILYKVSFFVAALLILNGCSEDDTDLGPAPEANFSVDAGSILKQGEEVTFINESSGGKSFLWSFGDGETAYGVNATHIYTAPGDYTVTLEASANGKRSIKTVSIAIEGLTPEAEFSIENEGQLKVAQPVQFVNESIDAISYLWDFGDDSNSTSTEESPTFTYGSPGDYDVTLTATGTGGSKSITKSITVNPNNFELYFIDNDAGKIRKIDLNNPSTAVDVFNLPGFSFGLSYDKVNEHFYYADDDAKTILRNDIAGGNEVEITDLLTDPRDIALDIDNDRLFVMEKTADRITEVSLGDGSKSTVYSVSDDADFLLPVGLDLFNGDLFATAVDIGAETVWTGNVDGSGITRIVDYGNGGYGYSIQVDQVNNKIYFDDHDGGVLLRADLDGSNIETIGSSSDKVFGIAINNETGKVYWASQDGVIKVANLDGTEEEVVLDVAADVRGLIIRKSN